MGITITKKIAKQGKERVKDFSWEKTADILKNVLDQVNIQSFPKSF